MKPNPSYSPATSPPEKLHAEHIRVRGIVQGVGFRPTVWKLAQQYQLTGTVCNDGDGVLIEVVGGEGSIGVEDSINHFVESLRLHKPALSRIDSIERLVINNPESLASSFDIIDSTHSNANTGITADAATCDACLADVFNEDDSLSASLEGLVDLADNETVHNRRHCYPFTNCTHCGPRLSIIRGIPYDRALTSMDAFKMCPACQQEYDSPEDRRFHAQPNACPECGPKVWLENKSGKLVSTRDKQDQHHDTPILQAALLIRDKHIVAIKGLGGIHLATCACASPDGETSAVQRLRERKHRPRKPFAIMVKDVAMAEQYCSVNAQERTLLQSPAAPIVLLEKRISIKNATQATRQNASQDRERLAEELAPGQSTLGVMLPYTPLHHQLLRVLNKPIVLTSGNAAHEPQCITNESARSQLKELADYFLLHNRDIENRVDDSVVRLLSGQPQFYRRARGYAPESIPLPKGFENAPDILAMGGELKNTFCLVKKGQATLSQHMGDLENFSTFEDFRHNLSLYEKLFQHKAKHIAIDAHPEYIPSKLGKEMAKKRGVNAHRVQHHHAHIAACLADNGVALNDKPVLGIALDGLGYGLGYGAGNENDHPLWGGEFLLADYRSCKQLAHFKPIALLGGSFAMKQPWRNTYAHLQACLGWEWVSKQYPELALIKHLSSKPLSTFDGMVKQGINCPLASSAGRLFDAVAAAVDICREALQYEGQAAIELEACITPQAWAEAETSAYSFSLLHHQLDPSPMWKALLEDLSNNIAVALISARFHKGLSLAIQQLASDLAFYKEIRTIALSGGVFQNKTLFEEVKQGLESMNFTVLHHRNVPANDGGLALGQAVITAAQFIEE